MANNKNLMSEKAFCYMVKCSNGSFYTGWTTDPGRRVREHNAGRGARYTRINGPVELVYVEKLPDRSTAQRREYEIKQLTHDQKKILAEDDGLDQIDDF